MSVLCAALFAVAVNALPVQKENHENTEKPKTEFDEVVRNILHDFSDPAIQLERISTIISATREERNEAIENVAILEERNKHMAEDLWVVKARGAIEHIERRCKTEGIVLSNEESKGATDDLEWRRRIREKRWNTMFAKYNGTWEIEEIITLIKSHNRNENATKEFAHDISVVYMLLTRNIHLRLFKKIVLGPLVINRLTRNPRVSSALTLLLSTFDFEPLF